MMVARGVPVVPNKFPVFLFAVLVFHRGKPAWGPPLRLGFLPVRFPVVPLFVLQTFLLCRGHFQFPLLQGPNVRPQTAVSANQGFLLLDWQSLQCSSGQCFNIFGTKTHLEEGELEMAAAEKERLENKNGTTGNRTGVHHSDSDFFPYGFRWSRCLFSRRSFSAAAISSSPSSRARMSGRRRLSVQIRDSCCSIGSLCNVQVGNVLTFSEQKLTWRRGN